MRYLDLGVILGYLIAITWFGAHFRSGQKSLRDYFLGGRSAPWWAISLSIISAETSTLTIVGTPGLSFAGNLGFLQIVFGYLLARLVISALLLPHYFRGEMFTAYELMRRRFGERTRKLSALIFLVTRSLAEGVRVFAISIVISIVLNTGEIPSILLIVALTLFYTFEGGMTAVIWTDVIQMVLYMAGAIVSFFVLLHHIPGGWAHVAAVAAPAGKFRIFDFDFSFSMQYFSRTYTFWAGLLGGCFLTTASHGTEQLIVQRLLAAPDERRSRIALLASWVVILAQFTLFLAIGVCLYVLYSDRHSPPPDTLDKIYPLDFDRAFKKLDEIKPYIKVWWREGNQSQQLLRDGEVDMMSMWNARGSELKQQGVPVEVVWNGAVRSPSTWCVLKGAPNRKLAWEFIQFVSGPKPQAEFNTRLYYGPTNPAAYALIPKDIAVQLPTWRANEAVSVKEDDTWEVDRIAKLEERFTQWLAS